MNIFFKKRVFKFACRKNCVDQPQEHKQEHRLSGIGSRNLQKLGFRIMDQTIDSLAEAFLKIGDLEMALANYEKALELDPKLASAKNGVRRIKILKDKK